MLCYATRSCYWLLKHMIFPILIVTIFGSTMSVIYISVYYQFTPDRASLLKAVAVVVALLIVVTTYVALGAYGYTNQSYGQVRLIMGYVGDLASICFYGSPMERIMHVLRTKYVASIPINMCVMGAITNAVWLVYSWLIRDLFVLVPNAICLVLTSTQLVLYAKYKKNGNSVGDLELGEISVVLSPKQLRTHSQLDLSKLQLSPTMESPSFHALRSPLSPLRYPTQNTQSA